MHSRPPGSLHPWGDSPTPFEEIGGEDVVRALVENFYDLIESGSPTLRALLPANTATTRKKFFMYLSGWLGGPPLYEERYGHPRLRMRHLPFPIGDHEAQEWLRCMGLALDQTGVDGPLRVYLDRRLGDLALHMRNRGDS
jgi:hemoglobin